ncbi:hypothetical protein [Gordonia soli]|uniref:Uncharacterized protein n=1 Tax=Gordonia soli NBRC 108243 TaxID=1223545 RepID=M0QPY8_9ACTN|nr:hypothetical protein [Gordonia soli]GAC70755.1 hypothetical protein GS4_41_00010 [Gordonia soli NBRC 108243]
MVAAATVPFGVAAATGLFGGAAATGLVDVAAATALTGGGSGAPEFLTCGLAWSRPTSLSLATGAVASQSLAS